MKTRTLLILTAAVSLVAGTGFAFANDDADDEGTSDETTVDQPNAPAHSMTDQGYSQRWFSSTGYGPNDEQADQTRELNRQALAADHEGTSPGSEPDDAQGPADDEDDMQGPSDEAAPSADDDDDDADGPDDE